jgi:hypothetical protein
VLERIEAPSLMLRLRFVASAFKIDGVVLSVCSAIAWRTLVAHWLCVVSGKCKNAKADASGVRLLRVRDSKNLG